MPFELFNPLQLSALIIAPAVVLQSIELIALRETFNDNGIWRWEILKDEFNESSAAVRRIAQAVLSYPNFLYLLIIRLAGSLLLPIAVLRYPASAFLLLDLLVLLLTTVAIAVRWRGTFNGGSDYMTIVILSGLTAAAAFPQSSAAALGAVFYIVIQLTCSYFISGAAKLRSVRWRSGQALEAFTRAGVFGQPACLKPILNRKVPAVILSWVIILFECTFPAALLSPLICLVYIACGVGFHLANVYLLGLNRFLWVWAAAYPALYWCSGVWLSN